MVEIFTGSGLGLERSSATILGGAGTLGDASTGTAGVGISVNADTGNLVIQTNGETLTGVGDSVELDAAVDQTYNSLGLLGSPNVTWAAQGAQILNPTGTVNTAGSTVQRLGWDGSLVTYTWQAGYLNTNGTTGAYVAKEGAGVDDSITNASGAWSWHDGSTDVTEAYGNTGNRVSTRTDPNGNKLTFLYSGSLLTRITTADGEYVSLGYTGNNLTQLTTYGTGGTKLLTRTYYTYDTQNRMTSVTVDLSPTDNSITDGNVYTTTFGYSGTSNLVTSVKQNDGSEVDFTYDGSNRVSTITQWVNATTSRTTTMTYGSGTTTVTDPQGNQTVMTYDAKGELLSVASPAVVGGTSQYRSFTYDANGNVLTESVYANVGNAPSGPAITQLTNTYDGNGNLLTSVDLAGDTTSYTYNAFNSVLTKTVYTTAAQGSTAASGAETTFYVYDTADRLGYIISPDGDVTFNAVNGSGQITSTLQYVSTQYTGTLTISSPPNFVTMSKWQQAQSAVIERTDFTYDFRGNLATETSYSATTSNGTGLTSSPYSQTTYVYDQAGELLSKQVNDGSSAETYVYDGLGRITLKTSSAGEITTTAATAYYPLVTTTSGSTTISYSGGPLSVGEAITGTGIPAGATIASVNAAAGTATLSSAATASGKIIIGAPNVAVASTRTITMANGLVDTQSYDRAGELISDTDTGSGISATTTSYVYDADGNLRVSTDPAGVNTYSFYDSDGRKTGEVDGDGYLTAYKYDAANRLVATVTYANALSTAQLASLAAANGALSLNAIQPLPSATDTWNWTVYDAAGRVSQTINAVGSVTGYTYDGTGAVTQTTQYATPLTSAQLAALIESTPGNNLIYNAGFNSGSQTSISSTAGWSANTSFGAVSSGTLQNLDNLQATYNTTGTSAGSINSAQFAVSAGQVLNIAMGIAATGPVSSNGLQLQIGWVGASGNYISSSLVSTLSGAQSYNTQMTGSATAPTGAVSAYISLNLYTNAGGGTGTLTLIEPKVTVASATLAPVTAATSAQDRTTRDFYNVDGLLIGTLDANGYLTQIDYDDAGQKIDTVAYATQASSSQRASGSFAQLQTSVGTSALDQHSYVIYDDRGLVAATIDPDGDVTSYTYTARGDVATKVTGQQVTPATAYTLATLPAASGTLETTAYTYDFDGRVLSETLGQGYPQQTTTSYTYDAVGNVHTVTNGNSYVTTSTYDALGRVLQTSQAIDSTSADNINTYYTYDIRGNELTATTYSATNSSGVGVTTSPYTQTTNTYDNANQLISKQVNDGSLAQTYTYDQIGRLVSQTDAAGNTTLTTYSNTANTKTITYANGLVETQTYNAFGEIVSDIETGSGIVTTTKSYVYDTDGNLLVSTDPAGISTYMFYNDAGQKTGLVDGDRYLTEYRYDAVGRLVATVTYANPLSATQLNSLATAGGMLSLTAIQPLPSATDTWNWTVYDAAGRVIQTINSFGAITAYSYDGTGAVTQTTQYDTVLTSAQLAVLIENTPGNNLLYNAGFNSGSQGASGVASTVGWSTNTNFNSVALSTGASQNLDYLQASYNATATGQGGSIYNSTQFSVSGGQVINIAMGLATTGPIGQIQLLVAWINSSGNFISSSQVGTNPSGDLAYNTQLAGSVTAPSGAVSAYIALNVYTNATGSGTFDLIEPKVTIANATLAPITPATNALDRTTSNFYNADGLLIGSRDANGYVTQIDYDDAGQKIDTVAYATSSSSVTVGTSVTTTNGTTAISFTGIPPVVGQSISGPGIASGTTITAVNSATQTATLSAAATASGTFTAGTSAQDQHSYMLYDDRGLLVDTIDPAGNVTSYTYSASGEVLTKTTGQQVAAGTAYTLATLPAATGNLETTTFTYDGDGRVLTQTVQVSTGVNAVTSYQYDAVGNLVATTDPLGHTSYNYYDKLNRVYLQIDAAGYATKTLYTADNEISSVTRYVLPVSGATTASAPTVTATPGSPDTVGTDNITGFTYDSAGNVLTSTDANGYTETYTYGANGIRLTDTNKLGAATYYTYDSLGRVLTASIQAQTSNNVGGSIIQGAYSVTSYSYNAFNQQIKVVQGFSATLNGAITALKTTNYVYDNDGNLTTVTGDAVTVTGSNGTVTNSSQVPATSYTYDFSGNVTSVTDPNGAVTYNWYDTLDRKIAQVDAVGDLTTYTYDAFSNLASQTVYGDPVSVSGWTTTPPIPINAQNGRVTTYLYNSANQLTDTEQSNANGTVGIAVGSWSNGSYTTTTVATLDTHYTYDLNGNLVTQTDPDGNVTTNWYDALGRKIAQLDGANYLTQWTYDSEGHALSETQYATQYTAAVNVSSPPATASITTSPNDRTTNFTYDNDGNRLTESRLNVVASTINASTGILTAASSTTSTIAYVYNALGQVTWKYQMWTGGTATPPAAASSSGQVEDEYVYDTTGRLIQQMKGSYTDVNNALVTPTTNYTYDALGNLHSVDEIGTATGNFTQADRLTLYVYGQGGRLLSETNGLTNSTSSTIASSNGLTVANAIPNGITHTYGYDADGNLIMDSYARIVNSDALDSDATTTTVNEAILYTRDALGRTSAQAIVDNPGSSETYLATQFTTYNTYGQVSQTGTNTASGTGPATPLYQVSNQYDAAGRLTGTNSTNGIWTFFGYDKAGNQTAQITSAGSTLTASTGFAGALSMAQSGSNTTVATYKVYDQRNMATQMVQPGRNLSASTTNQTLTASQTYDAFGEVTKSTNALGNSTTYTYNTMGKTIAVQSPEIQITNQNGATDWVLPQVDNFYDLGGRLIGTSDADGTYSAGSQSAPGTKTVGSGNTTTYALLNGTGYDGSQALTATQFNPDGGRINTLYDVMGDVREIQDALYSSSSPLMHEEERTYNLLDQLSIDAHNRSSLTSPGGATVTSASDNTTRLVDTYVDDQFGQQLQQWNDQYGSGDVAKMGYDGLGRMTSQTDMLGNVTTNAYAWNGALATNGVGTFGGWVDTMTEANGYVDTTSTDIYNREVSVLSANTITYNDAYDAGGRLLSDGEKTYTWYNTGQLATIGTVFFYQNSTTTGGTKTGFTTITHEVTDQNVTTYGYDAAGERLTDILTQGGSTVTVTKTTAGSLSGSNSTSSSTSTNPTVTLENETATYNADGWLATMSAASTSYSAPVINISESGTVQTPAATVTDAYDANGNIVETVATHAMIDGNENVTSTPTDTFWFSYDAMNRLVTNRGLLLGTAGASGTTVIRGDTSLAAVGMQGTNYLYDKAGNRIAEISTSYNPQNGYYQEIRQNLIYDGTGKLTDIEQTVGATTTMANGGPMAVAVTTYTAPGNGVSLLSAFSYDLTGRQTQELDYNGAGTQVYNHTASYNADDQLTSDSTTSTDTSGNSNLTSDTYKYYGSYNGNVGVQSSYDLGQVASELTSTSQNGGTVTQSTLTNSYGWVKASAIEVGISYVSGSTSNYTTLYYNGAAELMQAQINDGRPREINFTYDGDGEIINRDEIDTSEPSTGTPHEVWYRFGGRQLGYVGNNGTSETTDTISILSLQAVAGSGPFQAGATAATPFADFAGTELPINALNQGQAAEQYQVQGDGQSLDQVADQVWGDSNLWYLLADANGLSGDATLAAGQTLSVPADVVSAYHNASSTLPYNASSITGNLDPSAPAPQTGGGDSGCGAFAAILVAVIAIAVTAIVAPELTGEVIANTASITYTVGGVTLTATSTSAAIGVGGLVGTLGVTAGTIVGAAAAGAIGSLVGQGFGIAIGEQNSINWAGVGLSALGAGIGAGVASVPGLSGAPAGSGAAIEQAAARGLISGALTQGIGLATGLESRFDWVGVAASGVGAAVGSAVGGTGFAKGLGKIGDQLAGGTAGAIASAATRSLVTGTDFGTGLLNTLPQAIGNTIGNAVAGGISSQGNTADQGQGGGGVQYASNDPLPPMPGQGPIESDFTTVTAPIYHAQFDGGSLYDFAKAQIADDPATSDQATDANIRELEAQIIHENGITDVNNVDAGTLLVPTNQFTPSASDYAVLNGGTNFARFQTSGVYVNLSRQYGHNFAAYLTAVMEGHQTHPLPGDSGGYTNYGVSQLSGLSIKQIQQLTPETAAKFALQKYGTQAMRDATGAMQPILLEAQWSGFHLPGYSGADGLLEASGGDPATAIQLLNEFHNTSSYGTANPGAYNERELKLNTYLVTEYNLDLSNVVVTNYARRR